MSFFNPNFNLDHHDFDNDNINDSSCDNSIDNSISNTFFSNNNFSKNLLIIHQNIRSIRKNFNILVAHLEAFNDKPRSSD